MLRYMKEFQRKYGKLNYRDYIKPIDEYQNYIGKYRQDNKTIKIVRYILENWKTNPEYLDSLHLNIYNDFYERDVNIFSDYLDNYKEDIESKQLTLIYVYKQLGISPSGFYNILRRYVECIWYYKLENNLKA